MKLIPLTEKELKELRKEQWKRQGKKCAILDIPIDEADCVFDHKHKLKAQECGGKEGLGCLRGVLHRNANSFEGKLERIWKRYGLHKIIALPDLLRRCADYIEHPPMPPKYIHPKERKKKFGKLSKNDYKKICKYYFCICPKAKKIPVYPQKGYTNEKWDNLIKLANEIHNRKQSAEEIKQIKRAQELMKGFKK